MNLLRLPILPDMRCDRHCGECCKTVLATEEEFVAVTAYAEENGIEPKAQGQRCPWYQDGQCAVYPERPLICHLFGHVNDPGLTCCRGYNVNIGMTQARHELARQGHANRLLHEVLPLNQWLGQVRGWFKLPPATKTLVLGTGVFRREIPLPEPRKRKRKRGKRR